MPRFDHTVRALGQELRERVPEASDEQVAAMIATAAPDEVARLGAIGCLEVIYGLPSEQAERLHGMLSPDTRYDLLLEAVRRLIEGG